MPSSSAEKDTWHDWLPAGLALFFSVYYVLGVNPKILGDAGVPASAALLGTFLTVILGNLSGAAVTRTGLVIAPAVGISTFFQSFVTAPGSIDFRWGLVGCFLAGVAVVCTSMWTNWRSEIIRDLPEPVRKGAKAGIGALLVKKSFDLFNSSFADHGSQIQIIGTVLVSCSMSIILIFYLLRTKIKDSKGAMPKGFLGLLLHLEFPIVVTGISVALHWLLPDYINRLAPSTELSFLLWHPAAVLPASIDIGKVAATLVFAVIVWFIIISDIPGTPSEVLGDMPRDKLPGINIEDAIKKGYINDGWWALLSPICGTSPTIYYAENQILREYGSYSSAVGYLVSGLFALILLGTLGIQFHVLPNTSLERLVPPAATIPVLLFVGLYIIAVTFMKEREQASSGQTPAVITGPQYYLPAAIAVILTPRIDLQYALPISILSFWLVKSKSENVKQSFKWISGGSAFSLVFLVLVLLFHK